MPDWWQGDMRWQAMVSREGMRCMMCQGKEYGVSKGWHVSRTVLKERGIAWRQRTGGKGGSSQVRQVEPGVGPSHSWERSTRSSKPHTPTPEP